MTVSVTEILGWSATAVFVTSYFFAKPTVLRGLQMLGASLWILYGIWISAAPVIVANVLVFAAAAWTMARGRARAKGVVGNLAPRKVGV